MSIVNTILQKMNLPPEMLSKAKEAIRIASKYPNDMNGLKQAINDFGGMKEFNKALQLGKNPKIKSFLNKVGIDADTLEQVASSVVSSDKQSNSTLPNNIKDRLSRL